MGEEAKLEPCPNCDWGFQDRRKSRDGLHYIRCSNCGTSGPFGLSVQEAIDQWNGLPREPEPGPAPLVWTSEMPKTVGDYLVRVAGDSKCYVINIDADDMAFGPVGFEGFEYAGPIVVREPQETSE